MSSHEELRPEAVSQLSVSPRPRVLARHNPGSFADRPGAWILCSAEDAPVSLTIASRRLLVLCAVVAVWILPAAAWQSASLEGVLNGTTFRNVGPFRTSAWVTEIAVPDSPARDHLYTIYAATRTGGLWKTINNGVTWDPISDSVEVAAVGAVAVAPSNPSIVWMGTGDQANARSSYSGKGVYKSTDAGKTWQAMGLPDSHHISRIVIHPTNPEIVYVAAMGHLFSRNEERGVFRTRTGGKTWDKVLYVDDGTGATDLVINRKSPDTLYAAMYEKHRTPWQLVLGGPGSGVYRSDDGGSKWQKLEGLPAGSVGRIGLDIQQRNPNVLTVIVENLNARKEGMPARIDACQATSGRGAAAGGGRAGRAGGPMGNEVYRSEDGGRAWKKLHGDDIDVAGSKAPYSFNQIRTNPADPSQIVVTSDTMYESRDGGRTWNCDFFRAVFGDFRAIWWDEQDPQRIMLGSDGGVNVSHDGGRTADYFLNKRIGEVYAVGVDMDDPYNVYGGLQDHESWKGPSNSRNGMITLEDWTTVGTGDGMYNQVDPTNSRWVYNSFQTGGQRRFDQLTGQATNIQPQRAANAPALRYNWVTPLVLSPHNPQILYTGAQVLFPLRQPRRCVAGDQPRSHDWRCDEMRSQCQPRVRIAARRRHRARREERFPQRRLSAVSVSDDRLRQDVDEHFRQPRRVAHQRRRAGSQEPEPLDRRERPRRVGIHRRWRRVDSSEGEPANRAGARPDDPPARERSGARYVRPRHLPRRHHAPAGALDVGARQAVSPLRRRAQGGLQLQGTGELPPVWQRLHRGSQRARRAHCQLRPAGEGCRRGARDDCRHQGDRDRPAQRPGRSRTQPRALEHAGRCGTGGRARRQGRGWPHAAGRRVPDHGRSHGSQGDGGRPDSRATAVGSVSRGDGLECPVCAGS